MGDPWEDEGYAGEDDWEGSESVEADLEDDALGDDDDDEDEEELPLSEG